MATDSTNLTAPLGSTARTNQLLQQASAQTGIPAQTFTAPTLVADNLQSPVVAAQPPTSPKPTYDIGSTTYLPSSIDPNQQITDLTTKYLSSITPPTNPLGAGGAYNQAQQASGVDAANQDVVAKGEAVKSAQNELAIIDAQLKDITGQTQVSELQMAKDPNIQNQTGLTVRNTSLERDAAIRAIPLQSQALLAQAKIASAQGDLTSAQQLQSLAQNKFDTIFKIATDYATQLNNYNNDLRKSVYDFATKQQQNILDQQTKQEAQNLSIYNQTVSDLRTAASAATAAGQQDLATKIAQLVANLDPTSSTFKSDLAKVQSDFATYQGQIRTPLTAAQKNAGSGISGSKSGSYEAIAQEAINAGANPQQALEEAIAVAQNRGITLTKAQQDSIYMAASIMKPTTTSNPPVSTNSQENTVAPTTTAQPIYGKGAFAKQDIESRIAELSGVFNGSKSDIRAELINEGYPSSEVNKRVGNMVDKAAQAGSNVLNFFNKLF